MSPVTNDGRCVRVRARLPELLDGALAPLEEARDLGHLEACVGCARERESFTRTLAGVRALALVEPSELRELQAGLRARLAPRTRRPERSFLVAAAAAALLLALGSWFGLPSAPRAEDFARFEVLSGLSDLDGILKGLEDLTRRFS
jgi:anti-sigma factor RsiW